MPSHSLFSIGAIKMAKRINIPKWLPEYERWQIKVRKDGERKTFTSPIPGRKGQLQCQKKADNWLEENIIDPNIKVSPFYDKFLAELKLTTSHSNWNSFESYGNNYIKKCIGNKRVSSLTEQNLQDVILYAFDNPVKKKALSEKTLKNVCDCLKAFIKYARKDNKTRLYPENLYIPKSAAKSHKAPLQPDDLKTLFTSTKTTYRTEVIEEWYIYAYRFAVITGMRPGEIVGLENADIKKNICTIRRAINCYGEETNGKNENALRSFVIPKIALNVLREQKQMLRKAGLVSPYVFPSPDGESTSQASYRKHWKKYQDFNKLSKRTPYEMRHTFFSATKTLPPELVKAMGGHGKDFDTFGTYGHELKGEAEQTAILVDEAFTKILG